MAPTAAAALATWNAAIAALGALSDGVVCSDGFLPMLEVSNAVYIRCETAIRKVQALPDLTQGTWGMIIKEKVGVAQGVHTPCSAHRMGAM